MTLSVNNHEPQTSAAPLDAATVILLRESGRPFEVFLMRRRRGQAFGSSVVFPGGRLDQADCDPRLRALSRGIPVEEAGRNLGEPDLEPGRALGLYFTAVRETFEEAGLLLAASNAGGEIKADDQATSRRLARYREEINQGNLTLLELAGQEDLWFRLDRLKPYAHWITPEVEPRRFDTRFFMARAPEGQDPSHDDLEMTHSEWLTPQEALAKQETREIKLMPPTLKILGELAGFASLEEVFQAAGSRDLRPVMPQAHIGPEFLGLKLPHDSEYTIDRYKQSPRPDEPSRLVLIDGRWRIFRAEEFPFPDQKNGC
ncbi:MAG: NUDIX hydrolase [Pseudomonadota bacterium]